MFGQDIPGLKKFQRYATQYSPNQNVFDCDCFIARTCLATIFHSYHLFRPYVFMNGGRMVQHQNFLKRTAT